MAQTSRLCIRVLAFFIIAQTLKAVWVVHFMSRLLQKANAQWIGSQMFVGRCRYVLNNTTKTKITFCRLFANGSDEIGVAAVSILNGGAQTILRHSLGRDLFTNI